jgi:hypothetical protein
MLDWGTTLAGISSGAARPVYARNHCLSLRSLRVLE